MHSHAAPAPPAPQAMLPELKAQIQKGLDFVKPKAEKAE